MNCIENNPFRVLNVPVTATDREILRQFNKLEMSAEIGKAVSFPDDLPFLEPPVRTVESLDEARKRIQLDEQKFFHSLFWFWNNGTSDGLALELLQDGSIERAIEILERGALADQEAVFIEEILHRNLADLSWHLETNDKHSFYKDGNALSLDRFVQDGASICAVPTNLRTSRENWSIECQTTWLGGDDNYPYGIVFGKNRKSYFSFEIAANGYFRFVRTLNGEAVALIEWTKVESESDERPNVLKVKRLNGFYELYIDERRVGEVAAESCFGQDVGIKVTGAQAAEFQKFRISHLKRDSRYGRGIRVTDKNISNVKNLSTLFLALSATNVDPVLNLNRSLTMARHLFDSDQMVHYVRAVAGERFELDRERALAYFSEGVVDTLLASAAAAVFDEKQLFHSFERLPGSAMTYLRGRFTDKPLKRIEERLERVVAFREQNPEKILSTALSVIEQTRPDLLFLNEVLDREDFQFRAIADRLSNFLVGSGVTYFNETRNDEPCLPLYEYAVSVAGSEKARKHATENLESCKEWIKNRAYYFCIFCKKNPPDESSLVVQRMYGNIERTRFLNSSRVTFSILDVKVPRCADCHVVHEIKSANSSWLWMGFIFGAILGTAGGGVLIPGYFLVGSIIGAAVGVLIGYMNTSEIDENVAPLNSSTLVSYPLIQELRKKGWQFSEPTA